MIFAKKYEQLCDIPNADEFWDTLSSMEDLKTPSPDGFMVIFYKKCWGIVGSQVVNTV